MSLLIDVGVGDIGVGSHGRVDVDESEMDWGGVLAGVFGMWTIPEIRPNTSTLPLFLRAAYS